MTLNLTTTIYQPDEARPEDALTRYPSGSRAIRYGFALLLFGLASVSSLTAHGNDHPAQQIVRDTTSEFFQTLSQRPEMRAAPVELHQLIGRVVLPHFDVPLMAKRALGRPWLEASEPQRQAFVSAFEALLLRTYGEAVSKFRGDEVRYLATEIRPDQQRVMVRTAVASRGPKPVTVDYAMHASSGTWKVYDVAIGGVSLVVTHRSSFENEIRRGGLDGLIEVLRAENQSQQG